MQDKVAKVYAKAFSGLGLKAKEVHTLAEELEGFSKLIAEHAELRLVFASELFRTEKRVAVIEALCTKLKTSDAGTKALKLLASANRLRNVGAIAEELRDIILRSENIVPLKVDSKDELVAAQKEKIQKKFKDYFGKAVQANFSVDRSLIAGLRVTAEGKTYDGTIATRLARMKENLVGGL